MSFANGAAAIASSIDDMYRAFLSGDRSGFDAHLHDEVTVWETHVPAGLMSRGELDSYRDARELAGARPRLDRLDATNKRIDVWGDVGVARYDLIARPSSTTAGEEQLSRVTDVFRRIDGRWLIVHHHAEACRSDRRLPQHVGAGRAGGAESSDG